MSDKEQYKQLLEAKLEEWKADLDKYRAQAKGASAGAQLKMNEQVSTLEKKLEAGRAKLAKLSDNSGDAWESLKSDLDKTWNDLKSAFSDAADRFKE